MHHSPSRFCSRHSTGGSAGVPLPDLVVSFHDKCSQVHSTCAKGFNTLKSWSKVCLGHSRNACFTGVPFNLQNVVLLRGRGKVNSIARMAPRFRAGLRSRLVPPTGTEKEWENETASTITLYMLGCKTLLSSSINC